MHFLKAEIDFWDADGSATLIPDGPILYESMDVEPEKKVSTLKKLKQYPQLIEHVKEILKQHGEQCADPQRRNDKTFTMGIGTRRMREFLHNTYGEDLGHTTVWRLYKPTRMTDNRSLMEGGRHNLIDASTSRVRNSQLVKPHARGAWCAANIRSVNELAVDLSLRPRPIRMTLFAMDDLARFPLVVDAGSHLYARNRGYTLTGDYRNFYDHNQAVSRKLLMQTTGIVEVVPPETASVIDDEHNRPRYPRCCPKGMTNFLRGVPLLTKDTGQYVHWQDKHSVLDAIPEDEMPEAAFWITDNGCGCDPLDETNQYNLGRTVDKYNLLFAGHGTYAANHSSQNTYIERPWSQHKKAIIGQRFGQSFLGGRVAPTADQMEGLFKSAAQEVADCWDATVNVCQKGDVITAPHSQYCGPLSESEVTEALDIKAVLSTSSKGFIELEKNKKVKDYVRELNGRTVQTLNCVWVFSKEMTEEKLIELFGPTKQPFQPETFTDEAGQRHHLSFLQLKEKYKTTPQVTFEPPALQGTEKYIKCCQRIFRFQAQADRHYAICHSRGRKPKSKRKRPQKVPFFKRAVRRRVQAPSVVAEEDDGSLAAAVDEEEAEQDL